MLRAATPPVSGVALRRQLGVKDLHLSQALAALEHDDIIDRTSARLAPQRAMA